MAILIQCQDCGQEYRVGDHRAGTRIPCKACGSDMQVPRSRQNGSQLSPPWLAGIAVGLVVAIGVVAFFAGRATVSSVAAPEVQATTVVAGTDKQQSAQRVAAATEVPRKSTADAGVSAVTKNPPSPGAGESVVSANPASPANPAVARSENSTPAPAISTPAPSAPPTRVNPPPTPPRNTEVTQFEPDYDAIAKAHPVAVPADRPAQNKNGGQMAGEGFGGASSPPADPVPAETVAASKVPAAEPAAAAGRDEMSKPPADTVVAWGVDDADRSIPYKDDTIVRFSPCPSRFAMVGTDMYDMSNGKKTGSFPPEIATGRQVISPGGSKVAMHHDSNGHNVPVVLVYSIETPDAAPVRLLNNKSSKWLRMMRFLDETRLIAYCGLTTDNEYVIWDTVTGKEIRTFGGEPADDGAYCFSPDSSYMAVADHDEVLVYDVKRGRLAARMAGEDGGRRMSLFSCHGLAFSPDAKQLAGLFHGGQLIVWSAQGEILLHEVIPGTTQYSDAKGIYWLPDGSGWFIGGNSILDRETLMMTWKLGSEDQFGRHDRYASLIDQNHVLTTRESGNGNDVIVIPIPWADINKAVAALDPAAKPLLGKGSSVSLKLNVGEVRFEEKQKIVDDITEMMRKRLAAAQISLAANQPAVINITYQEKPGRESEITRGFIFGGERTGQRVTNTEITATFELQIDGKQIWTEKIDADGMGTIEGEINEQNVRNAAYKWAFMRFDMLAIPTRIGNDPDQRLPLRTSLH